MDNMVSLLAKLKPIEEKILDLKVEKTAIVDDIDRLRKDMIRDCVHPYQMLSHLDSGAVQCKFCNRRFTTRGV